MVPNIKTILEACPRPKKSKTDDCLGKLAVRGIRRSGF
jgi:hypothetical protein